MKLKVILIIMVWILLYIAAFRLFPYFNDKYTGCALTRETYSDEIKAVVVKKFVNTKQHNFETIIYQSDDNGQGSMVFATIEYGDMFDYLQ